MVNYLLESRNVNVNETDKEGQTALIKACLLKDNVAATRRKLIRILLSKGAGVGNVDVFGRNVLMWACFLGKVDVVKILFDHCLMDIDFNCVDHHGNTALHYVSSAGHFGLTTMLVEAMKRFGISVDRRNKLGVTPFLEATKHGKEQCARVLLNSGASPDTVDPETLMNVKELAEKGRLNALAELISITRPSTQSRWTTFPSEPDDNDVNMTSENHLFKPASLAANSSVSSVDNSTENVFKSCGNFLTPGVPWTPVRNASSATLQTKERIKTSLNKRARKRGETFTEMSSIERERRFLEMSGKETCNSFLKTSQKMRLLGILGSDLSRTSSCKSLGFPSRRATISSVSRQTEVSRVSNNRSATSKDPYDLSELKDLLSLQGEQKSSSFRIGFSTPTITPERFKECLSAMEPVLPGDPDRSRRSSSSTTSTGATVFGTQSRRQSVLLKDAKSGISNSLLIRRRGSSTRSYPGVLTRIGLNRKFSDPTIQLHQPISPNSTHRRQSFMS